MIIAAQKSSGMPQYEDMPKNSAANLPEPTAKYVIWKTEEMRFRQATATLAESPCLPDPKR